MALVVGGILLRPSADRKWRSFVLEIFTLAGWMLVAMSVIKPLVPANVLGITILVVIVLCVMAVPLAARRMGRQRESRRRPLRSRHR
ncbi:hypothetical protein [Amycolatopsis decaplanina]|uniref:hypothetical protein n=1 Tax=Amycolatopsis decaplanina TaxID=208441 RepID=UPI00034CFB2C|nr:hypothetical protein [Amycolatopsis decaplanina]